MATKKKAAAKAAPKKAPVADTVVDGPVPSKLVLGKKNLGNEDDAIVYEAARVIMASGGSAHVSKGKLNLFLFQVSGTVDSTEEAQDMVAHAFDSGVLKAAPKAAKVDTDE